MGAAAMPFNSSIKRASKALAWLAGTNIKPGLVQNWPTPKVSDAINAFARDSVSWASLLGKQKIGLTEPISAYTGMGSSRWLAN